MKISYEKTFQGAWRLTAIVNGHFFSRQYFGYTKKNERLAQNLHYRQKQIWTVARFKF